MRVPKPIAVLKALLFGSDVKLPDEYTYRYDKGDEKQGPRLCIVAQMSNELGNYEPCTIGSDLTLQQFIQLCEQVSEDDWVGICANNAMNMELAVRREKRLRHVQYGPVTLDFGPSPLEKVLTTEIALRRIDKAVEDSVKSRIMPVAPKDPFQDLPWVGTCSECGEPQYATPSGNCCKNGHGGAPSEEDS